MSAKSAIGTRKKPDRSKDNETAAMKMRPTAFAVKRLTEAELEKIGALVKKAMR